MKTRIQILPVCLFLSLLSHRVAFAGDEGPYPFKRGQDAFFVMNYHTGSEFVAFRANGTYRRIRREHMFVGRFDEGRWKQTASGEIQFCSSYLFRARAGRYGRHLYLVMLSDGSWIENDEKKIRKELDQLKLGQLPGLLFYGIQGTDFERETRRPQPFLFHTEMNDRMKKAGAPVIDLRSEKLDRPQCKGF